MSSARYLDLLKQGFMKPMKPAKVRRTAAPTVRRPVVACDGCRNWHTQGKHTEKDAAVRKANVLHTAERDA